MISNLGPQKKTRMEQEMNKRIKKKNSDKKLKSLKKRRLKSKQKKS